VAFPTILLLGNSETRIAINLVQLVNPASGFKLVNCIPGLVRVSRRRETLPSARCTSR